MDIISQITNCYFENPDNKGKLNATMKKLISENGIDDVESVVQSFLETENKEVAKDIEASFNLVVDKLTRQAYCLVRTCDAEREQNGTKIFLDSE